MISNEMTRNILAIFISFAVMLLIGPIIIPVLRRMKFGQRVRSDGPQTHLIKQGTPTMGGVMIIIAMLAPFVLLDYKNSLLCIFAAAVTLGFGLIGFLDDYIKVYKKRSLGLRAYQKIIGQLGIAVVIALFVEHQVGTSIIVPFAQTEWDLGVFYIPFAVFVVVGIVNSVNLLDGLDGLAGGVSMICMLTFTFMGAFISKNLEAFGSGNITLFTAAVTGATLGFLVFNSYPAKVFMGDTGSLGLGGALSVVCLITRLPIIMPILAFTAFISTLSVIIQVASFKLFKRRVFKMAPIHHHYELKGMAETKVVSMYYIITAIACLVSVLSLI